MAFDYSGLSAAAVEMIAEFGTTAILRAPGEASGDPWAPVPGTPTDTTVKIVFVGYAQSERTGSLVQVGDREVYLSTDGLTSAPLTDYKLVHGAVPYEIIEIESEAPNGDALVYRLWVRS